MSILAFNFGLKSHGHKRRILVDKMGEFSWTFFGLIFMDIFGEFSWTLFLIVMNRVTRISSNNPNLT